MTARRGALFVHRRTYRRRRITDAARLPLLGAVLFVIPLLWKGSGGDGGRTAWVMAHVFLVWAGLSVLSGVLSRYLTAEDDDAEGEGER